jgi:hypothetical protein
MAAISHSCERARSWASLRADGELSQLESALLDAHLGRCSSCGAFAAGAEAFAPAIWAARLEHPQELALVLPRRRPALWGLQVAAAAAVVAAAGAVAALVGSDEQKPASTIAKPVAIVASSESPDAFRAFRRTQLVPPPRQLPRNGRFPDESA